MRFFGSKGRFVKEIVFRFVFGKFLGSFKGVNIFLVLEDFVFGSGDMNGF